MNAAVASFGEEGTLVLEQRFAIVPEWIIDAAISDCAFRLYAVLLRYGQPSGQRMPGRALLATRLRKCSRDTVDRALKELVSAGAVAVEHRHDPRRGQLTNRYLVRSSPPGRRSPAPPAAVLRPDPEALTQSKNPPPRRPPVAEEDRPTEAKVVDLLRACVIDDVAALATRCAELRRDARRPAARWDAPRLVEVPHQAVVVRGWPAALAVSALLAVAADPATRSPMRLAEAGPWWDTSGVPSAADNPDELERMEWRLAEQDGRRLWLQRQARAQLTEQGRPGHSARGGSARLRTTRGRRVHTVLTSRLCGPRCFSRGLYGGLPGFN